MRRFLPTFLLFALVGAAVVPAAYEAGQHAARMAGMGPRVRAVLTRYRQAPQAMPADSVFWLGTRLAHGRRGERAADPVTGRRLIREAGARGSGRALRARAMSLMHVAHRHTEARWLLVEAMRHGHDDAFFDATLAYARLSEADGLPVRPDSLVLFYRRIRPLGGAAATQTVRSALDHIAAQADAGRPDAQRVRADLQGRGLWEVDG